MNMNSVMLYDWNYNCDDKRNKYWWNIKSCNEVVEVISYVMWFIRIYLGSLYMFLFLY